MYYTFINLYLRNNHILIIVKNKKGQYVKIGNKSLDRVWDK